MNTDVFLRAVPWSEIILSKGQFTNDLNTNQKNRLGVGFANITVACVMIAPLVPAFVALAGLSFFATLLANTHVLKQFWKERGAFFTFGVVPLHFVHQLCSGVGFAIGLRRHYLHWLPGRSTIDLQAANSVAHTKLETAARPT